MTPLRARPPPISAALQLLGVGPADAPTAASAAAARVYPAPPWGNAYAPACRTEVSTTLLGNVRNVWMFFLTPKHGNIFRI